MPTRKPLFTTGNDFVDMFIFFGQLILMMIGLISMVGIIIISIILITSVTANLSVRFVLWIRYMYSAYPPIEHVGQYDNVSDYFEPA